MFCINNSLYDQLFSCNKDTTRDIIKVYVLIVLLNNPNFYDNI